MKIPVARQLLLFAAVLAFLALLIGWSAFVSWREIRDLRQRLDDRTARKAFASPINCRHDCVSSDYISANMRRVAVREDWRSFEGESRQLAAWLKEQQSALTHARREGDSFRDQHSLRRLSCCRS